MWGYNHLEGFQELKWHAKRTGPTMQGNKQHGIKGSHKLLIKKGRMATIIAHNKEASNEPRASPLPSTNRADRLSKPEFITFFFREINCWLLWVFEPIECSKELI